VAGVARLYAMHRRTLTRRLGAEGTGFKRLADEIQFEIACELLANPKLTFGQVAAALKFSEPSAFTRAFRRWSGQNPTEWCASHPGGWKGPRSHRAPRPRPDPDRATSSQTVKRPSQPVKQGPQIRSG
jgi:AraC-like DNA-binding protein